MSESLPLRATTYQPVARGTCPHCDRPDVNIRFVFNPYDADQLMCVDCGDRADEEMLEHQHPDMPRTPHPASDAARELGDVFTEFRKTLAKKDPDKLARFDKHLEGPEETDKDG